MSYEIIPILFIDLMFFMVVLGVVLWFSYKHYHKHPKYPLPYPPCPTPPPFEYNTTTTTTEIDASKLSSLDLAEIVYNLSIQKRKNFFTQYQQLVEEGKLKD